MVNHVELWGSTRDDFVRDWKVETPPVFDIEAGTGTDEVLLTPTGVRGLVDGETYLGTFDGTTCSLSFVFKLTAAGLTGGNKKLSFASAVDGVSPVDATGGAESDSGWGASLADFEDSWSLASGTITIQHADAANAVAQAHFDSVSGLQDGVYRVDFDSTAKQLSITFRLDANGHVGGDPNSPRELIHYFPEVPGSGGVPTEGERFEEVESGGGGGY